MKKILSFILVLCVLFTLSSCEKNGLEDFFADWEARYDPNVAIVCVNDYVNEVLYCGRTVSLDGFFSRRQQVTWLTVDNDTLYCACSFYDRNDEYKYRVDVYAIDLIESTYEILPIGRYYPTGNTESIDPQCYYFNRNVYVYDGVSVTVFNIDSQAVERSESSHFSFASIAGYTIEVPAGYDYGYRSYIKIISDSFEREFAYEYLAQRNEYAARLGTIDNKWDIFNIVDPLEHFFYKAYLIGDTVYLVCVVEDADQEANCIVFSYNCASDTFEFLYHTYDPYGRGDLCVIPVE